jgi:hypothetical protein
MKVDKKKFIECVEYIRGINHCKLSNLDLSEFDFDDLDIKVKNWELTGLNNKQFILYYNLFCIVLSKKYVLYEIKL